MFRTRMLAVIVLLVFTFALVAGCAAPPPAAPPAAATQVPAASSAAPAQPTTAPTQAAASSAPAAQSGTALTIGIEQDIKTMDPTLANDIYSMQVMDQLFNFLVYTGFDGTVKPGLATKWAVSNDGLTWDFELASNVLFHDGSKLTAGDVVYSFQHIMDPATKSPYAGRLAVVKDLKAVDDTHFSVTLKAPTAPFIFDMTTIPIVPKAAMEKLGSEFAKKPVGSGPFKFVSRLEGDRVTLERFDQYFGGPSKIARLVVRVIPEASVRVTELETGNVDMITGVPASEVKNLESKTNLALSKTPGTNFRFWAMNVTKPPFDNKLVRQAVAYAFDRDKVIQVVYPGLAVPSYGPFPSVTFAYDSNFKGIGYDPAKSKALLAQAGFANGFSTELLVSNDENQAKEAALFVEQLAAVGIKATVKTLDFATLLDTMVKGNYQIGRMGWTPSADPHSFVGVVFSTDALQGYNFSKYSSPQIDDLTKRGAASMDQAQRTQIYRDLQKQLVDDSPVVFAFHEMRVVAYNKKVVGFQTHPNGYLYFTAPFAVDVSVAAK